MIDWKYIIKRVIVGIVLFVSIFFLKKYLFLNVKAETLYPTNSCVIESVDSSTCHTVPNYRVFTTIQNGFGWNIWFQSSTLLESGNSYSIVFTARMKGVANNVDVSGSPTVWVGNNGSAGNQAYPDRNESYTYYKINAQEYQITWAFDIDSLSNLNTIRFSGFTSTSPTFGQTIGITSSSLSLYRTSGGSSNNDDIINNQNENANSIINNQTNNTQNIINNNNQNTQDIIDNQNSIAEQQNKNQQVCTNIDSTFIKENDKSLNSSGEVVSFSQWGYTDYISVKSSTLSVLYGYSANTGAYSCFYDSEKSFISCFSNANLITGSLITVPINAQYVRLSVRYRATDSTLVDRPQFEICTNGNQALQNSLDDESTSKSKKDAESFFGSFDNYENSNLSSLITSPLRFFNKITDTCQAKSITYRNSNITIPCGTTIFWEKSYVSSFRIWWNMFFGGLSIYFLGIKLFKVVQDALNPDKDVIEVIGL